MGYVYAEVQTTRSSLSTLTTGTSTAIFPTSNGLLIDNNSVSDLVEDEQHYLISQSELDALGIDVDLTPLHIRGNGKRPCNFYKRKRKDKNIFDIDRQLGHVYFFKSANSYKVGCSCKRNIKNRVRSQCPDEVLAVSKARGDYKDLEKKIHRMFAKNRVGKYEIFNDLTEDEVQKIKKLLGNTIAVEIKLRGQK
tara:strand:- start:55 stop:636 length:582 start_codon:yes stop_codon:yes gene_type:complete